MGRGIEPAILTKFYRTSVSFPALWLHFGESCRIAIGTGDLVFIELRQSSIIVRQRSTIRGACTAITGLLPSEDNPKITSHHKTTIPGR